MQRQRRREAGVKGLRPEQADPFDAAEFAAAVLVGLAAGEDAGGEPIAVDRIEADGSVSITHLPDSPYSRAGFALRRHFGEDERAFKSALMRFRALMDLFSRGALGPWARSGDGGRTSLHPAVIDVASRMRLSDNGRFAPRKFVAAVADAARASYPGLAGWPVS